MAAGEYVGRIGGLAVALGIGAAIFAGQGVALADEGTPSGQESSVSAPDKADTTPAKVADPEPEDDTDEVADEDTDEDVGEDAVDQAVDEDVVGGDAVGGDVDEDEDVTGDVTEDTAGEDVTEDRVRRDKKPPTEKPAVTVVVTKEVAEAEVIEAEPVVAPVVPVEPVVADPGVEEPAVPVGTDQQVVEKVETAEVVTTPLSAVTPEEAADEPEDPAIPAVASLFTSLVAAGREVTEERASLTAEQPTLSLVEAAATQYPRPTGVEVIEWTPPLEWLQNIPVLGRFVVTPLVGLMHAIPLLGDILHPVFGFPIDHDAPPGTPKARNFLVKSFDGTRIFVNFMPAKGLAAGESAPTILSGPGLGLPGATTLDLNTDGFLPTDVIGIGALRAAGYNVVTWDPRGEWRSGGQMQLQSPDFEGRDISYLISHLATLDEVQTEEGDDGDPKIGMVGASYGGGIQLATAAIDHRIDAIVPTIAWNSLPDVLFPRESVRSGWGTLLSSVLVLTLSRPNPRILPAAIVGILTGYASPADIALLNDRGYADQIGDITAPTLLFQGTVDTLFTLQQADANAKALIAAGTTTKVVWYCGGHGACLSSYNNGDLIMDRTLDWLNRYVKGQAVDTGDQFEWVDQNGDWFSSSQYPVTPGEPVEAERTDDKSILFFPFIGGSGPNPLIVLRGLIPTILGLPSAAPATNAVNLKVPDAAELTHIVGAPELTLTYSGTGNAEHVYAQIVDDETQLVLGNLTTAIPVELDGESHTVTYSLEPVAHTLKPGQSVTVQLVTSTINYLNFYSGGAITVEAMSVKLPTLSPGSVATADSAAA